MSFKEDFLVLIKSRYDSYSGKGNAKASWYILGEFCDKLMQGFHLHGKYVESSLEVIVGGVFWIQMFQENYLQSLKIDLVTFNNKGSHR